MDLQLAEPFGPIGETDVTVELPCNQAEPTTYSVQIVRGGDWVADRPVAEPAGEALLRADRVGFTASDVGRRDGITLALHKHQWLWIRGATHVARGRLLRILCGLERPLAGEIWWKEQRMSTAVRSLHAELGFLDCSGGVRDMLTPLEHLRLHLGVRGACPRIDPRAALRRVGLATAMDVPAVRLDAGDRWRLAMARLLVTRATVWAVEVAGEPMPAAELSLLRELAAEHLAQRGVLLHAGSVPLFDANDDGVAIDLGS